MRKQNEKHQKRTLYTDGQIKSKIGRLLYFPALETHKQQQTNKQRQNKANEKNGWQERNSWQNSRAPTLLSARACAPHGGGI